MDGAYFLSSVVVLGFYWINEPYLYRILFGRSNRNSEPIKKHLQTINQYFNDIAVPRGVMVHYRVYITTCDIVCTPYK